MPGIGSADGVHFLTGGAPSLLKIGAFQKFSCQELAVELSCTDIGRVVPAQDDAIPGFLASLAMQLRGPIGEGIGE